MKPNDSMGDITEDMRLHVLRLPMVSKRTHQAVDDGADIRMRHKMKRKITPKDNGCGRKDGSWTIAEIAKDSPVQ